MESGNPDLLYGAKAIAAHLGLTEKQARHRIEKGNLPTFKWDGTVCALRSTLNAWLAEKAAGTQSDRPV